jgi:hypothetical protein
VVGVPDMGRSPAAVALRDHRCLAPLAELNHRPQQAAARASSHRDRLRRPWGLPVLVIRERRIRGTLHSLPTGRPIELSGRTGGNDGGAMVCRATPTTPTALRPSRCLVNPSRRCVHRDASVYTTSEKACQGNCPTTDRVRRRSAGTSLSPANPERQRRRLPLPARRSSLRALTREAPA